MSKILQPTTSWLPLNVLTGELSLRLSLNCGQSFTWRSTGDGEWTGVIGREVVGLKEKGVCAMCFDLFRFLTPSPDSP